MSDPSAYWLNIMNVVLGLVVLICCAAVAVGVFQEVVARRRKRAAASELDREMSDLVTGFDGHAFNVPNLGLTMADGGMPLAKDPEQKKAER